jgi:hypothetical protein
MPSIDALRFSSFENPVKTFRRNATKKFVVLLTQSILKNNFLSVTTAREPSIILNNPRETSKTGRRSIRESRFCFTSHYTAQQEQQQQQHLRFMHPLESSALGTGCRRMFPVVKFRRCSQDEVTRINGLARRNSCSPATRCVTSPSSASTWKSCHRSPKPTS